MNKRVYPILLGQPQGESRSTLCFERGIKNRKDFLVPPFLHQNQKFDTLARQQSRFDSSHKRAAMSVSPVFGNAIAAFCFN